MWLQAVTPPAPEGPLPATAPGGWVCCTALHNETLSRGRPPGGDGRLSLGKLLPQPPARGGLRSRGVVPLRALPLLFTEGYPPSCSPRESSRGSREYGKSGLVGCLAEVESLLVEPLF